MKYIVHPNRNIDLNEFITNLVIDSDTSKRTASFIEIQKAYTYALKHTDKSKPLGSLIKEYEKSTTEK